MTLADWIDLGRSAVSDARQRATVRGWLREHRGKGPMRIDRR